MHILFINSFYSPHVGGGAELICQEQAEAFLAKGHRVSVIATGPKGSGIHTEDVNGVTVHRIGIRNRYWHFEKGNHSSFDKMLFHLIDSYNFSMKRAVYKIVKEMKPDIAICHNLAGLSGSVWCALKQAGVPIIQVLHDQYIRTPNVTAFKNGKPYDTNSLENRIFRLRHRQLSNIPSAVVGVSHFILETLKKDGFFQKTETLVIHNARNLPETTRPLRGENETLRFGYMGTLSSVKGLEWLISAFMGVRGNISLTIAGRGDASYEQKISKLAEVDNRISFIGYSSPSDFYPLVDVAIVPSLWPDTLPTVAFEACAFHVPVIASNQGGLPEIISDGLNGIVCDTANTDSLRTAIERLSLHRGEVAKLSWQARRSVREYLDTEANLLKYEQLATKWHGART